MTRPARPMTPRFLRDPRGFTGAEKALLICFGLAIITMVGVLARGGSQKAGGDAERTLAMGRGALGSGAGMGEMIAPGTMAQAKALQAAPPAPQAAGAIAEAKAPAAPAAPAAPRPLPNGLDDRQYDGALVGADGRAYPPGTPLTQVPPVLPANGQRPNGTIIYVNGILTDKDLQFQTLQNIANTTGAQTIGIHNATGGGIRDLTQSVGDKAGLGQNPAVDRLADALYESIRNHQPIHIMAHSQGALITSRAIGDVQRRLMIEDGLSRQEAERLMGNIKVETFGGAAGSYPNGPQYRHYINRWDPVGTAAGLGATRLGNGGAGRGAEVIRFNDFNWNPVNSHSIDNTYLPRRRPF